MIKIYKGMQLTPAQRRTLARMIVDGTNNPDMRSAAALARLGLVDIVDYGVIGKMVFLTADGFRVARETSVVEEWLGGKPVHRKGGISYTSAALLLAAAEKIAERAAHLSSIETEARERLEATGGDAHAALTALNVEDRNVWDPAVVNRFYEVHAAIERIG